MNQCVFVHMYMFTCMYVYMYTCIYVYYVYVYMYMYIFIYVYMFICIYVYMFICIYVCMYPVALRAIPATVPTNASQDPVPLPKPTKLGPKIHQIGVQNPSSWGPKTIKINLGRGLGEDLGPSWPQEAPRPLQRAPRQN